MNTLVSWIFLTLAAPQGADAVTACRAAHEADPRAHIACLERALGNVPAPAPPPSLGAEQIPQERAPRPDPVDVEIVSINYDADGRRIFGMADGQVWRETEVSPDNRRLPGDKRYQARIERGQVRGYRLHIEGVRRMIKVERLK